MNFAASICVGYAKCLILYMELVDSEHMTFLLTSYKFAFMTSLLTSYKLAIIIYHACSWPFGDAFILA